jgi:Zn-dependent peptidase ImmA (M78 family)
MRSFNEKQEEEANWLAWRLLLPRQAIVEALKKLISVEEIAVQFGVSEPLVRFRVQKIGAQVQLKRARIPASTRLVEVDVMESARRKILITVEIPQAKR